MYTATYNITGYLPDDEPADFETTGDAWRYLQNWILPEHDESDTELGCTTVLPEDYGQAWLDMDVNINQSGTPDRPYAVTGTVYLKRNGPGAINLLDIAFNVEKKK